MIEYGRGVATGKSFIRAGRLSLPFVLAALAVVGCGGGDGADATFSVTAFDSIEQGDSAQSVRDDLGEPAATDPFGKGSELWVYCDGASPRYLVVTDDEVSIPDVRPPDELRISDQSCD